ncbi:MAG: hypothetical protein JWO38_4042 [Gemmataceae bacterium]|nr:hypothetical protein [Gemmataceae bacterium]
MAADVTLNTTSETVDLTGLPEPVVQDIRRLVQTLREKLSGQQPSPAVAARPPLMGRFADLKLSIPREHIDEAQAEAWAGLPRDFPEPSKGS